VPSFDVARRDDVVMLGALPEHRWPRRSKDHVPRRPTCRPCTFAEPGAPPAGSFGRPVAYSRRVRMSRLTIAAVVLFTMGCTGPADGPAPKAELQANLSFAYFGVAETGMIDQTVTITNSADVAAIPTLSFVALDDEGRQIKHVGSDQGLVVAPAQFEVFDILRFEGDGAERVADVAVAVEAVTSVADKGMAYPEVEYLDATGRTVPTPTLADIVRVTNPGRQDYVVRLVGVRWDVPPAGRPQQARRVSAVGEPVSVRANDATDVTVPAPMRGTLDSLKAYISTE
jgi:hypothetical protein